MTKTLCAACLLIAMSCVAEPPKPPDQPATGPGGRDYTHDNVRKLGPFGEGAKAFWLYEPDAPAPVTAPVIAFLHGYTGVDARVYGNWIEHLVRRGNIVIFPLYQTSLFGADAYTANALAALKEAFHMLREEPGHVRPDKQGDFAFVAHSLGCPISANLISMAEREGLPKPKAFMACHAGDVNTVIKALPSLLDPPENIPDLLMLVVVGADDLFVGDVVGRAIFTGSTRVKPKNKNLIVIRSDGTGHPALESNHFAPLSVNKAYATGAKLGLGLRETELPGPLRSPAASKFRDGATLPFGLGRTDALDFYGYWKWFDALTDAAFHGTHRNQALGDTPEQKFMGTWSDGTPVNPAVVELGEAQ